MDYEKRCEAVIWPAKKRASADFIIESGSGRKAW